MTGFLLSDDEAFIAYKGSEDEIYITDGLIRVAQAQHDRTYSLAKAEGIKEVVEWGNEECPHSDDELGILCIEETGRPEVKRECELCWQAKLKEWGIK